MPDVGERYHVTRERVAELVAQLGPDELALPVPACPGWTVHDVVAHLSGVVDDGVHGRIDGVATPPWTAAQVERGRGVAVAELLERWEQQAPTFEQLPLPAAAVIDITSHEQDIRGALARPGYRDAEELVWACEQLARRATHAVPGLRIEVDGRSYGPTESGAALRGDRFELFRTFMGRRSLAQLRRLDWEGEPPDGFERVMVFGPATADLVE